MKCPICNFKNSNNSKYCANCGNPLVASTNKQNNNSLNLKNNYRKTKRIKIAVVSLASIIVLFLIAIGIDQIKYLGVDSYDNGKTLINKDTVILDSENSNKKIKSIDGDKIEITTKQDSNQDDNKKIKVGTIICSGKSSNAPNGILKKVESITEESDGEITVITKQAALTDVIKRCDVSITANMTSGNSYSISQTNGATDEVSNFIQKAYADDLDTSLDIFNESIPDNPFFEGGVRFTINMYLKIDPGFLGIGSSVKSRMTANVYAGAKLKELNEKLNMDNKELANFKLPPIEFSIVFVPVVITNSFKLSANGSLDITSALLKAEAEFDKEAGFEYESGNGIKVINEDRSHGPDIGFNVTDKAFCLDLVSQINLAYEAKLYGVAGFNISAGLKGEGLLSLSNLDSDEQSDGCIHIPNVNLNLKGRLKGKLTVPIAGNVTLGIDGLNIFDGKDNISKELFNTGDAITLWEIDKAFPESERKKDEDKDKDNPYDDSGKGGTERQSLLDDDFIG